MVSASFTPILAQIFHRSVVACFKVLAIQMKQQRIAALVSFLNFSGFSTCERLPRVGKFGVEFGVWRSVDVFFCGWDIQIPCEESQSGGEAMVMRMISIEKGCGSHSVGVLGLVLLWR